MRWLGYMLMMFFFNSSCRWYRSMVDPHSDTQYTCQILDGGDEPIVSNPNIWVVCGIRAKKDWSEDLIPRHFLFYFIHRSFNWKRTTILVKFGGVQRPQRFGQLPYAGKEWKKKEIDKKISIFSDIKKKKKRKREMMIWLLIHSPSILCNLERLPFATWITVITPLALTFLVSEKTPLPRWFKTYLMQTSVKITSGRTLKLSPPLGRKTRQCVDRTLESVQVAVALQPAAWTNPPNQLQQEHQQQLRYLNSSHCLRTMNLRNDTRAFMMMRWNGWWSPLE